MSCGCEHRKLLSERERVSELARKAAVMEQCMYVVYRRKDGTYGFDRYEPGMDVPGEVVEYRHYL